MADEAHGHGHGGGLGKPKPATLGKLLLALTLLLFMMQLMEWVAAGVGTEEQEEEQLHHYGIFLLLLLLIMGLIIGWFLDIKSISWMPEAGACLLIGVVSCLQAAVISNLLKVNELFSFVLKVAGGVLELNGSHEGENGAMPRTAIRDTISPMISNSSGVPVLQSGSTQGTGSWRRSSSSTPSSSSSSCCRRSSWSRAST
eukprot:SAG31_NODE_1923_length_6914_cov_3.243580_2_plen_200_part_00